MDKAILEQDREERRHYLQVIKAFTSYKAFQTLKLKQFQNLNAPAETVKRVQQVVEARAKAIAVNQKLLDFAVQLQNSCFSQDDLADVTVTHSNLDKVSSTLRQVYRQWSAEGRAERDASFAYLIEGLKINLRGGKVLVPGAGLGRLSYQLAKLGYEVEGNQFSYHMLFVSEALVNHSRTRQFTVYPFAGLNRFPNQSACLQGVRVPDQSPLEFEDRLQLGMAAGEFLQSYPQPEAYDAVLTCFFVDTAHDLLEYIDAIWRVLKAGGLWLNCGPLLYHYSGDLAQLSVELSAEEFRAAVERLFSVEQWMEKESLYCHPPISVFKTVFQCQSFIARKNTKS